MKQTPGRTDEQTHGRIDEWTDELTHRRRDERKDKRTLNRDVIVKIGTVLEVNKTKDLSLKFLRKLSKR